MPNCCLPPYLSGKTYMSIPKLYEITKEFLSYPIGSMGLDPSYLHENQKKSTIHVGKQWWTYLVGGVNPPEKYQSKWESSPSRDENKKCLKPPPRYHTHHRYGYLFQRSRLQSRWGTGCRWWWLLFNRFGLHTSRNLKTHYRKDVGPGCWKWGSRGLDIIYPKNPDPSLE